LFEPSSEMSRKVAALAGRLRVLHAELAEQVPDMRTEQLRDEVQRALAQVQADQREPFLQELARQFPLWSSSDGVGVSAGPAPAAATPKAAPAPEPKDPKSVAEKLIELSRGMSDAEKQAIAARLSAAGLVLKQPGAPAPAATPAPAPAAAPAATVTGAVGASSASELRRHLGLPADVPIDAWRVTDVAAMLAEFTLKLEPYACMFWKDIAPEAKNQVYQTLNKDLGKYMQGDEKVTREVLARGVYNLRSLVSLLLKGVVDAGKQFSRDHLSRFSVEEISKAAGPGSLMTSKDVLCWKQYVRQMEGMDAQAIEKRLKSLIAKDVDAGLGQVIK
jgi:hypothetical protein